MVGAEPSARPNDVGTLEGPYAADTWWAEELGVRAGRDRATLSFVAAWVSRACS
jgi:hypothetical protein